MFSIRYIEKSSDTPNGQIFAEIFDEASWIYKETDFPFVFEIWNDGFLKWSCDLNINTWTSWHCLENNNLEAFIKDKNNNIISHFKLDTWVNRNSTEQFFDTWIMKNPNSNGIVIGTHDGTHGEWVKHVKNKQTNVILVEGSKKQFNELVSNYSNLNNVKFRNEIITGDGRETEFFEFGLGQANTVDKSHFQKHVLENDDLQIINTKSISINDLITQENLQNNLDWLHLDTEAIDDEIIMGLNFSLIKKPKLIVFETINFSVERTGDSTRINKLFDWLKSKNYKIKYDYWNSFAYLS
jgi:FkbM family methyltransferase